MATKRRFVKNTITLIRGLLSRMPTISFVAYVRSDNPFAQLFVFAFDAKGVLVGGYDIEVDSAYNFVNTLPTVAYFFECCLKEQGDCFNSTTIQAMWHEDGYVDVGLQQIYGIDKRPFMIV